jgi:hypothetical protein
MTLTSTNYADIQASLRGRLNDVYTRVHAQRKEKLEKDTAERNARVEAYNEFALEAITRLPTVLEGGMLADAYFIGVYEFDGVDVFGKRPFERMSTCESGEEYHECQFILNHHNEPNVRLRLDVYLVYSHCIALGLEPEITTTSKSVVSEDRNQYAIMIKAPYNTLWKYEKP